MLGVEPYEHHARLEEHAHGAGRDGPEVLRPTLGRGPAGLDEDALVEAGAREFLAADGLCRVRTAQVDDAAAADEALEPERGDVHGAAVEMHRGVDMRAHVRRHVDRRDVGNSAVVDALVPEDLERRVAREYGRSGAYGRGNVPKAAHAVAS